MEQEIDPQLNQNKNKLLLTVVFSVLLTAVVVGSVIYMWQKSANEKVVQNLEQKISVLEQQVSIKNSTVPVNNLLPSPTTEEISSEYVQPKPIAIDEGCLKSQFIKGPGQKISVTCNQVGKVDLSSSVKAVLRSRHQEKILRGTDYEFDVYLEFYENSTKLNVPPYYFPSFAADVQFFGLNISYLDKNNIYISDSGGHEGYPSHYLFSGTSWSKFSPWDLVKNVFPDTIHPPFSVLVSQKYIKITEERYCCDQVYSNTPEREANRMVFILDRVSKKILETSRISR